MDNKVITNDVVVTYNGKQYQVHLDKDGNYTIVDITTPDSVLPKNDVINVLHLALDNIRKTFQSKSQYYPQKTDNDFINENIKNMPLTKEEQEYWKGQFNNSQSSNNIPELEDYRKKIAYQIKAKSNPKDKLRSIFFLDGGVLKHQLLSIRQYEQPVILSENKFNYDDNCKSILFANIVEDYMENDDIEESYVVPSEYDPHSYGNYYLTTQNGVHLELIGIELSLATEIEKTVNEKKQKGLNLDGPRLVRKKKENNQNGYVSTTFYIIYIIEALFGLGIITYLLLK